MIGAGIVGVSCAAELAATGRRVVVLERAEVAAGASGRNSGVVQHPFDPVLVELHLETLRSYRGLAGPEGGGGVDGGGGRAGGGRAGGFALAAEPAGLLLVTHDADLARRLADDLLRSHPGLSPTFLDPDEARALEPTLAPGISACRLAIGYPVAPASATRAWADRARRLGVDIRVGEPARPWLASGRVAGVELASGARLAADHVVVAAGPWTPEVIDPSGAWRPIRASWGVVVGVDLADPPAHVLEEAEIDIEPAAGPVGSPGGARGKAAAGHSFSLVTAGGMSSLGSTFLDEEPDAAALVPDILVRGTAFVPGIAAARVGAQRLCARPLSADGRPLVGRVPGMEGLWVAAGHGPWGISTGPASGRLIADLIAGRIAAPPPALDPARFPSPRLA